MPPGVSATAVVRAVPVAWRLCSACSYFGDAKSALHIVGSSFACVTALRACRLAMRRRARCTQRPACRRLTGWARRPRGTCSSSWPDSHPPAALRRRPARPRRPRTLATAMCAHFSSKC